MKTDLGHNFLDSLKNIYQKHKGNRVISTTLFFFSLLYSLVLLILARKQLISLDWKLFFWILIICVCNYLISSVLQSFCWSILIDGNLKDYKTLGVVYYKSMLMGRIPGGFWHWVGRSNLISETSSGTKRVVAQSNLIEWVSLSLTGLSIFMCFRIQWIGILLFLVQLFFVSWLVNRFITKTGFFQRALIITLIYALCWVLGSLFLKWLVNGINPKVIFTIPHAIEIWTIFSVISNVFFFVPSGMVVREFTLGALFNGIFSSQETILLSLQLRFVILVADIFTALLMMQLIKFFSSKKNDIKAN